MSCMSIRDQIEQFCCLITQNENTCKMGIVSECCTGLSWPKEKHRKSLYYADMQTAYDLGYRLQLWEAVGNYGKLWEAMGSNGKMCSVILGQKSGQKKARNGQKLYKNFDDFGDDFEKILVMILKEILVMILKRFWKHFGDDFVDQNCFQNHTKIITKSCGLFRLPPFACFDFRPLLVSTSTVFCFDFP